LTCENAQVSAADGGLASNPDERRETVDRLEAPEDTDKPFLARYIQLYNDLIHCRSGHGTLNRRGVDTPKGRA